MTKKEYEKLWKKFKQSQNHVISNPIEYYYAPELKCNCHCDSDARKKYYDRQKNTRVIIFKQRCMNCGYQFWHVHNIKEDNNGE